jgi:hypothetical protein
MLAETRGTDEIVQQITSAFADVTYPGQEALFNHHCCECADVSRSYGGKQWTDITLEDVLAGSETALLTPVAWRYYLPAVMVWCVRAPEAVDVIEDNLVFQLEPPDEHRGVPEWFNERATGFTRDQRSAIVAYLHWYRKREAVGQLGGEALRHVDIALAYWAAGGTDAAR